MGKTYKYKQAIEKGLFGEESPFLNSKISDRKTAGMLTKFKIGNTIKYEKKQK